MSDKNCKYYSEKLLRNNCTVSCRCIEREAGDAEMIETFPCTFDNYLKCEYFLQESRFN